MSKPRQKKLAATDPKWTATDLDGEVFLALCRRNALGEVYLWQFGVGSSAGLWSVCYRDLVPAGDRGENRPGLRQGYSPVRARGLANRVPVDGSGVPDATGQTPDEQQGPALGAERAVSARPATERATTPNRDARRPSPPAGGRPWNGGAA